MELTSSPLLFEGYNSRYMAFSAAKSWHSKPLEVPLSKPPTLKKEDARLFVSMASSYPPEGRGSIVLGPVDTCAPGVSDVLLKTLEGDPDKGERYRFFLWCYDSGSVIPTIRSRCLLQEVAAGTRGKGNHPPEIQELGQRLWRSYREGDLSSVVTSLLLRKGDYRPVLECLIDAMVEERGIDLDLWSRVRDTLGQGSSYVTMAQTLSVMMGRP